MEARRKEQNQLIGSLMKEFAGRTVDFYNHLDEQPVCRPIGEETLQYLKEQPIPDDGRPIAQVYEEMLQHVYAHTLLAQHPRSFSCIPSTVSLLSWMGDVMTGACNPHASCQTNAPAAYLIEKKLIDWMCRLAGFPKGSGGLFVSGGSIANLTALTAARDAKLSYAQRGDAVIYVSDQTHASALKGLYIIGFRRDHQHGQRGPTGGDFRSLPAIRYMDACGWSFWRLGAFVKAIQA